VGAGFWLSHGELGGTTNPQSLRFDLNGDGRPLCSEVG
jgi:hypothetical protein